MEFIDFKDMYEYGNLQEFYDKLTEFEKTEKINALNLDEIKKF
jgi:hypothetical protein